MTNPLHQAWLEEQAKKPAWIDFPEAPQSHLSAERLHLAGFRERQHERMRAAGWAIPPHPSRVLAL